jgi:6-phosphogluconolactonase
MKLYTGSYTEEVLEGLKGHGEGLCVFDFNENDGSLEFLYKEKNRNTAYMSFHEEANLIYTFQELTVEKKPKLLTFIIKDIGLELMSQQDIQGGLPCHIQKVEGRNLVLVACYQTGNILVYTLDENGIPNALSQEIKHKGKSLNVTRQEAAHAHMVNFNSHDGLVYVPDLGMDKIVVYKIIDNQLKESYSIDVPIGGGPRHMVFHPSNKYAFVMNELTGHVSVFKNENGRYNWKQNAPSLPEDYKGDATSSAIKISKSGRFVYCGNRGIHAISIFEFDEQDETLILLSNQDTCGKTPRDFTLSPSGKWLIVANQDSDTMVVFEIDESSGRLRKAHENMDAKSVSCLKFN